MAKKVKKDGERKEEKKVVFEEPEFDEREYLTEQLHNIRLTVLFIVFGVPMGLLWAFIAATTGSTMLGFAACFGGYILGIFALRSVLGIDVLSGPKKTLATTLLMFLFTSLAFAVLLSNPPAMDHTPPSITNVIVDFQPNMTTGPAEDWEVLMVQGKYLPSNSSNEARKKDHPDKIMFLYNEGVHASQGDRLSILVRAADASGLNGVWLEYGFETIDRPAVPMVRVTEEQWNVMGDGKPYELWGEHYYQYQFTPDQSGLLYYKIRVEDNAGHETIFETTAPTDSIDVKERTA